MRGIYKRNKTYWISYAGLDGKVIRESSHSQKFADAESLLLSRKTDVKEGKQPDIKRVNSHTFKELAGRYTEWMQGRHRSASSKEYRMRDMIGRFGHYPLSRFNVRLVEQYQTDLMNRGLKAGSVNKNLSILKAMFKKAVEWDMIGEDTLKRVRSVKLLPENNRRLRYLSVDECKALTDSCAPYLRPIIITALNTGMRKGEVLGLKWNNIDLRHGFILLDRTKNGERREIPINDTLRATLQGVIPRLDVPYVFHDSRTGKPYVDVKKGFKTALRRSGIHDFRFHDLRHTFASHLVMAGIDLTTVKELLGHKTLTMTLRYAHLAPAHKVKALDTLNGVLSTSQKVHNFKKKRLTKNG